jgi:hypothetical protein
MMRWVSVLLILLVALVFEARAADYFLQSRTGTSGSLTTIKVPGGTGKVWVFDASGNLIPATIGSGLTLASGVLTAAGGGGGVSDGDKGDLNVSGLTWTINNGVVTAAKLAGSLDLSGKTLTLPSDVTRLGSTIAWTSVSKTGSSLADLATRSAADLSTGTLPLARLGSSGTASSTTYLRGDNTWATPAGGGGSGSYDITITSLAQLAAKPTVSLPTNTLLTVIINSELQDWQLITSGSATSVGVQRPNDYGTAPFRVWVRRR